MISGPTISFLPDGLNLHIIDGQREQAFRMTWRIR
jgi:hypothetical protein